MPPRKSEFELIDWIRAQQKHGKRTRIGIGDDCAAIDFRPGETCLVTTDALVDGVHFDLGATPPELVGRKAIAVSLSDVAAMGGRAIAAVATTALPGSLAPSTAEGLCRGLMAACEEFRVDFVGGDIVSTPGQLTITTTVLGAAQKARLCRRSGAKVGDAVLVTGDLGGSILGKHLYFTPRLREAQRLVTRFRVHAMIDISDGLSRDLSHILDESGGLGAELDAVSIPCSAAAHERSRGTGKPSLWHALNDGEDFELLFAASQRQARRITAQWRDRTRVSVIGTVTEKAGIWMRQTSGRLCRVKIEGYEHLRP